MGSREPRPGSPARLRLRGIAVDMNNADEVEVVVKMSYYTWCCNGAHELADASKAVERLFRKYEDTFYDPATDPDEEVWQRENEAEDE